MTIANALAEQVELFPFTLRQPWLTFAPRRLPRFNLAINWSTTPHLKTPPDLIITTGRKAAAVGKHFKHLLTRQNHPCKHIQILNPKDNLDKYDWVLIPEHDNIKGTNVINFVGSIHPYDQQWFKQDKDDTFSQYLAIFIGNPQKKYFESKFAEEIRIIHKHFKETPLYFCGSPRLDMENKEIISSLARSQDKVWLNKTDGPNPYESLLKNAKKIFVTSDSINMINEPCASSVPVSILAKDYPPSPKHRRFFDSIKFQPFEGLAINSSISIQQDINTIREHILKYW